MAAAAVAAVCLTSCTPYTGINSLPLPGTVGTGPGSYEVKVQLANADDLVANTPVFVNDINIGTVTHVGLDGWTPTLTLSLNEAVRVPANAVAALGQTSLLGSKHIELSAPPGVAPEGTLQPGATVPEDRTHRYPETEDLLSGVSLLLNGGGLQHFETITTELNRTFGGDRAGQTRDLLTQLDGFVTGLDKQKGDIVTALHGFDRLGSTLQPRMAEIDTALQQLPEGLDTLDEQEPALVEATHRLGRASESIAPFADGGSREIRGVVRELEPTLRKVGDTQKGSIPRALRNLPFIIFPVDIVPYAIRGDYVNIRAIVNLTLDGLDKGLFTGTPASGLLYQIAQAGRNTRPDKGDPTKSQSSGGLPARLPLAGPNAPSGASHEGQRPGLLPKALPGIGGN
ncbi:MAG TPA: MCE family protein [Pseudonocardia sp.]|jgi:phospholipid/cholesterol/gamma-HCH transport system substrate-binding protein